VIKSTFYRIDMPHVKNMSRAMLSLCAILTTSCSAKPGAENAVAELRSKDVRVRVQAASRLAQSTGAGSVQPLVDALRDSDAGVRAAAAESLGIRKVEAAVAPLTAALYDKNMWVRASAASALGEIRSQSAAKPLVDLIDRSLNPPKESHLNWSAWKDANAAAFALKEITGKDFAFDIVKWKSWLAEHKS
jgi:HEAT repeat protein